MIRNILFDVDGTIWDAVPVITEAWNLNLAAQPETAHLHFSVEELRPEMGKTMREIANDLFPEIPEARRLEIADGCVEMEDRYIISHSGDFYPLIRETMVKLYEEGYGIYIVSNCQKGYIEAMMNHLEINEIVRDTECYGNTMMGKAYNIGLLMQRNGLTTEDTIYFGDTEMDEKAADDAGLRFVHAAYGFGGAVHPAAIVEAPEKLPEALNTL